MTNVTQHYGIDAIIGFVNTMVDVGLYVKTAGKDGFTISEAGLLLQNQKLMDELGKALQNLSELEHEATDLQMGEVFQLAGTVVPALTKLA